jgi:hypothetical protein
MPAPIDPNSTENIHLLQSMVDDKRLLERYRNECRDRIAQLRAESNIRDERFALAKERRALRDIPARRVRAESKKGDPLDYRNVQYATRRSFKTMWQRLGPTVGVAWAAYKWMESEGIVPPLRKILVFFGNGFHSELIVASVLVGGLSCIYFAIQLFVEIQGEHSRGKRTK